LGSLNEKPASSRPLSELPKTEDLYRQSAASHRRQDTSSGSTEEPVIQVDNGLQRLALTLFVILLLSAIGFFLLQNMI
jgi:hypothetical protein